MPGACAGPVCATHSKRGSQKAGPHRLDGKRLRSSAWEEGERLPCAGVCAVGARSGQQASALLHAGVSDVTELRTFVDRRADLLA